MRQRGSTKLSAAQRFELAKLSMQLELEARRSKNAKPARRRSVLAWMRYYNAPLTLLAGLLSGAIGGVWGYVIREPPRDPPAVVQPYEPKPNANWRGYKPPEPKSKPEDPLDRSPFQYRLLMHEMPNGQWPKPVKRAVYNAGILVAGGQEQAAKELLKSYLATLGYAKSEDAVVMTDWNTFAITPRAVAPTLSIPSGFTVSASDVPAEKDKTT